MLSIEWIILYIALGTFVGFMSGLLGVGGGGLLVPLLTSVFMYQGISSNNIMHLALATSLACMIFTSISSVYAHTSKGTVLWNVVTGMTPGIMMGAFITTQVASHLNSNYVALFFALFMALIALQTFLKWSPKPSKNPMNLFGLIIAGIGIGSGSAIAVVGGGFLTVVYLSYKNIDIKKAIGTSAAIGLPIAITSTIGYMLSGWTTKVELPNTYGFIYLPAFILISFASVISATLGARCSHSFSEIILKKIFAIVCLTLSFKMLISFW